MKYTALLLALLLLLCASGCTPKTPDTTETSSASDSSPLLMMPVGAIRNSGEIAEPEYNQRMLNRFEAEALLPKERLGTNKKTEDVTLLGVYNRSFTQVFLYGDGANEQGLNGDFLFFVRGGAITEIFDAKRLGLAGNQPRIRSLFAADFNGDEKYEIYLNIDLKDAHTVVGIDLADNRILHPSHEGNAFAYFFEDHLFLIEVPQSGTKTNAVCIAPMLRDALIVASEDSAATENLRLAALNEWILSKG